jgi:hypothetical protein
MRIRTTGVSPRMDNQQALSVGRITDRNPSAIARHRSQDFAEVAQLSATEQHIAMTRNPEQSCQVVNSLSFVVRDQDAGGSNPLAPPISSPFPSIGGAELPDQYPARDRESELRTSSA